MVVVHTEELLGFLRYKPHRGEIDRIRSFLVEKGTFSAKPLESGLFPATGLTERTSYTGYRNVWVRDNIYLSYSYYVAGQPDIAVRNVRALMAYFSKYNWRFEDVIEGKANPDNAMERPHIRFDGTNLEEITQEWNHAQNDALGYFLWFFCRLANTNALDVQVGDLGTIALFAHYFQAIRYWDDADSGHWEEEKKLAASSLGVVVAALEELTHLIARDPCGTHCAYKDRVVDTRFLDELINKGKKALDSILPWECVAPLSHQRRYDSALLFLIYPLRIVEGEMADRILADVIGNLEGDYGFRRYLGDSFWCRDYKDVPQEIRTTI